MEQKSGEPDDVFPEGFDLESFGQEIEDSIRDGVGRKICIRAKHCVRKISCEHAQVREATAELQDLFQGKSSDFGDCSNWKARTELNTQLDLPRRRGGGSRHNQHANREAAVRELIRKIDAGEPLPNSPYTPEELRNMLNSKREKALKKYLQAGQRDS